MKCAMLLLFMGNACRSMVNRKGIPADPTMASIIFERLDRMMEVHVLCLHSLKLGYRVKASDSKFNSMGPQNLRVTSVRAKKTQVEMEANQMYVCLQKRRLLIFFYTTTKSLAIKQPRDTESVDKTSTPIARRVSLHTPPTRSPLDIKETSGALLVVACPWQPNWFSTRLSGNYLAAERLAS